MIIPDKGYDPIINDGWKSISIYTKSDADSSKSKEVKLPKWLSNLINTRVEQAELRGVQRVRSEIRKALGI